MTTECSENHIIPVLMVPLEMLNPTKLIGKSIVLSTEKGGVDANHSKS